MKFKNQYGISLLEVLLVVLIAAAIVSGAVAYYSQTMTGSRVSQAANQLQSINKAGYEWLQIPDASGQYPQNFSGISSDNGLDDFTTAGLISCENKSCYTNPWGGTVVVSSDPSSPQYMLITVASLPETDCKRLVQQMVNIAPAGPEKQNSCSSVSGKSVYQYQIYL